MACPLCDSLPLKELKKLDEAIALGDSSIAELAAIYSVDTELIRLHLEHCLTLSLSGPETLSALQNGLQQIAGKLKKEVDAEAYKYVDQDSNIDGRGIVPNYIAVLRELRENVMALNRLQSTEGLTEGLNEKVVTPLINQAVQICVAEGARLREELFKAMHENYHNKIDALVKQFLTRIGERLLNETVRNLPQAVEAVLTAN